MQHFSDPIGFSNPKRLTAAIAGVLYLSSVDTAANPPTIIELSELNTESGFTIGGGDTAETVFPSLSAAGDVNGDGIDDFLFGSPFGDANGETSGQAYVIYGSEAGFPFRLELPDLDGDSGVTINGAGPSDQAGSSVSGAGDFNGDGFADVLIGAPEASPKGVDGAGATYLIFGSADLPAVIELSELNQAGGVDGLLINGIDDNDGAGRSVGAAGDFNNDSLDDIIIGAPGADPTVTNSGQSYVVFGQQKGTPANLDLSNLNGSNGFALNGVAFEDFSGRSVGRAGDVNHDGIDDVVIGAWFADPNGSQSGATYVVFGRKTATSASMELSTLDGENGFTINGVQSVDRSGRWVSSAGDINGDGISDVAIGAYSADRNGFSNVGESYVVFGKSNGFPPTIELSALDGSNGFVVAGQSPSDSVGVTVSSAGDFNDDGLDDLLIGARPFSIGSTGGINLLIYGQRGDFPARISLDDIDGSNGSVIRGVLQNDLTGVVSGTGDINNDGVNDIVVTAIDLEPQGLQPGGMYVLFGLGDQLFVNGFEAE